MRERQNPGHRQHDRTWQKGGTGHAGAGGKRQRRDMVPWLSSVLNARFREWMLEEGFSESARDSFWGKSLQRVTHTGHISATAH